MCPGSVSLASRIGSGRDLGFLVEAIDRRFLEKERSPLGAVVKRVVNFLCALVPTRISEGCFTSRTASGHIRTYLRWAASVGLAVVGLFRCHDGLVDRREKFRRGMDSGVGMDGEGET